MRARRILQALGVPGSLVGEKEPTLRVTSRTTRPVSRGPTAERLLGASHPLARAVARRRIVRRQLTSVGVLLAGSVMAQRLIGVRGAGVLVAPSTIVELALTASLAKVASDERRLA